VTEPAAPGETERLEVSGSGVTRGAGGLTWICPACGAETPLADDRCAVCGTPFARLFEEPVETRPMVSARSALTWSLVFPGLGHWQVSRRFDAIARIVLFVWTFGTVVALVVSRSGAGGLGQTASLFWLFLVASVLLYATSAVDAYRIASDEEPMVGSRTLLWCSAGLVVLSVVLATLLVLPAARGR
jgi:hypothetical protein